MKREYKVATQILVSPVGRIQDASADMLALSPSAHPPLVQPATGGYLYTEEGVGVLIAVV